MASTQGSAGRYGTRYGNILRKRVNEVEKGSRARHKCPYCGKDKKVKRESYGIWKCSSCERVFAGKAFKPY